ncbi:hypothetical protein BHE74_00036430 [Ensete ventricosum]|nr:hypothetical protein BHE74_00036430 [Ensete ventricosum]
MGSRTRTVLWKNMMVINFARSRTRSQVSIDFSCIVSEIQNNCHSRHISPREVVRTRFRKKCNVHKRCMNLRTESSFDRFFMYDLKILK